MNLANIASFVRILLIPFFVYCLLEEENAIAFGIFLLAGITDYLDGYFARAFKERTKLGSYLDPAADKLLVAASFITLTILKDIPLWLTILVFTRDLVISLSSILALLIIGAVEIRPTLAGKGAVFFQLALVLTILVFKQPFPPFLSRLGSSDVVREIIFQLCIGTAFFTALSGVQYLYRGGKELIRRSK